MSGATTAPRYHGFDGLRALMMLLGIYLHAAVAYAPVGGWPYKQAELTPSLNLTLVLIHVFRMPVFYVMAGFFTALLYERRGFRGAAGNRVGRILIPFVVGWAILFPLVAALVAIGKGGLAVAVAAQPSGPWWLRLHPLHLWFLEYLLLLYVGALVVVPAVAALPAGWRAGLDRAFRWAVGSWWAPLLFAVPSCAALLPMRHAGFDDPPSFIPAPHIVIAYAIPFAFGWLLYRHVDLLAIVRRRAWGYALLALVAGALFLVLLFTVPERGVAFLAKCASHSLLLWCLIFGITGLFLRYLDAPSAAWRWLCDASYFLYLAHMPVIMAFQLLLEPVAVPPIVKVFVVLSATILGLAILYRYAVRPTAIGATLNGRRYPVGSAATASA